MLSGGFVGLFFSVFFWHSGGGAQVLSFFLVPQCFWWIGFGPKKEGEIDIWANGERMAEVRGNLGCRLTGSPDSMKMYFKFGIYRNPLPYALSLHFDRFRQGKTQAEVM